MDLIMKFEDIFDEWKKDCDIDRTDLAVESLKIPKLHHKYYMWYIAEKNALRKLELQMKELKLAIFNIFTPAGLREKE